MPRRSRSRIAASEWQAGPMVQMILARRAALPAETKDRSGILGMTTSSATSCFLGFNESLYPVVNYCQRNYCKARDEIPHKAVLRKKIRRMRFSRSIGEPSRESLRKIHVQRVDFSSAGVTQNHRRVIWRQPGPIPEIILLHPAGHIDLGDKLNFCIAHTNTIEGDSRSVRE